MRTRSVVALASAGSLFIVACGDRSPGLTGPTSPITRPSAAVAWGPEDPIFNLEVVLRAPIGRGFGLVKFRQPNDDALTIYLDTWVRDLAPNTSYALQREVDLSAPDGVCAGESGWLTLGKGLTPQAITTDASGTGRESLSRSVAAFPVGREFDIHFRVVDDATKSVVALVSDCYRFTISQ
jgi:hypothetical protein